MSGEIVARTFLGLTNNDTWAHPEHGLPVNITSIISAWSGECITDEHIWLALRGSRTWGWVPKDLWPEALRDLSGRVALPLFETTVLPISAAATHGFALALLRHFPDLTWSCNRQGNARLNVSRKELRRLLETVGHPEQKLPWRYVDGFAKCGFAWRELFKEAS